MEEKPVVSVKEKSSKECFSELYSFLNGHNTTTSEHNASGCNKKLKIVCAKYVLVLLNVMYMLTSMVMINIGTIGLIVDGQFYSYWRGLHMLSIYWVVTGVILLCVSVFGIIAAFKMSVICTNIYGVLMAIVFIVQISSAIVSFQFIGQSKSIAYDGLNALVRNYVYFDSQRLQMDWIQNNFQCCGNDAPSDWSSYSMFSPEPVPNYFLYKSTTTLAPTPMINRTRTPSSCCVVDSNYTNRACEKYNQSGCVIQIRELISASVMILGSVALAIAVLEILGIVLAFVVEKVMRKTKSYIEIQKYDTLAFNEPNTCETAPKTVEQFQET